MSLFPFVQDEQVRATATISPCQRYRYDLTRRWGPDPSSIINFIMLNPSTADASTDDPTIRRCVGFAKSWGYDGLVVTNLYGLRATDPRELWKAEDPVGPGNDDFLLDHAGISRHVILAYGAQARAKRRAAHVLDMLAGHDLRAHALRITRDGHPCHPLYLPACLTPIPFPEG